MILRCQRNDAVCRFVLTKLGLQYDFVDAFDDCDCADVLLQIRGHPLMIPWTSFDDFVDILDGAAEKLRITEADNLRI